MVQNVLKMQAHHSANGHVLVEVDSRWFLREHVDKSVGSRYKNIWKHTTVPISSYIAIM